MEEDSHGVEPVKPRKAQLVVDAPGIVCAWLEHLELVDGVRGDVVCTDEPAVRLIPAMCAVGRPPAWFFGGGPRRSPAPCLPPAAAGASGPFDGAQNDDSFPAKVYGLVRRRGSACIIDSQQFEVGNRYEDASLALKPGPGSGVTLRAVISSPQWVQIRRGSACSPQVWWRSLIGGPSGRGKYSSPTA